MVGNEKDFLQPRLASDEPQKRYRWACTLTEDRSPMARETWSVAFCHRPSGYHMASKALYWRKVWGQTNALGLGDDIEGDSEGNTRPVDRYDAPRDYMETWPSMFATVNSNFVRIYTTKLGSKPELKLTAKFGRGEELYCVAWVYNADGKRRWWVIAGGKSRIIRVIDVKEKKNIKNLTGHGADIYDVKVHPRDSSLIITASKDESIRMWNLRTGATIVQFQGLKAHHGEVVSLDFDLGGTRFASCSIDNSVRIWDITRDKNVVDAILESHDAADKGVENVYFYYDESGKRRQSRIHIAQQPVFNTRAVHKHYVDCVMWVGDALISKSLHNALVLWLPGSDRSSLSSKSMNYTLLQEFPVSGCDVWFIRFGMDTQRKWIAVGGKFGKVHVYNLSEYTPKPIVLSPGGNTKVNIDTYVRQCAFSDDASILITVDDNTNLVQYERYTINKSPTSRRSTTTTKPKRDVEMKSESCSSVEHDHYMQDVPLVVAAANGNGPAPGSSGGAGGAGNVSTSQNGSIRTNQNGVGVTSPPSSGRDSNSSTTSEPQVITPVIQNASSGNTRSTPTRTTPRRTPTRQSQQQLQQQQQQQQNEIEIIMIDSD